MPKGSKIYYLIIVRKGPWPQETKIISRQNLNEFLESHHLDPTQFSILKDDF